MRLSPRLAMNESDVLLRLLKCKSEVEKAKRDKEACHVQIRTWYLCLASSNSNNYVNLVVR